MINKQKLSYVWLHLVLSIPIGFIAYLLLHSLLLIEPIASLCIALLVYITDVVKSANFDYIETELKLLKEQINKGK